MGARSFYKIGSRTMLGAGFQTVRRNGDGVKWFSGVGLPKSGTSGTGTEADGGNGAPFGSIYVDESTGLQFVNDGTVASPYWFPVSYNQPNLLGWYSDFRDGVGVALSGTNMSETITGTGVRVFGQGVADTDSGLVVTMAETDGRGALATLTTTDEDAPLAALSFGTGTTPLFQPDQNGTIVFDARVTNVSAITLRAMFFGFLGAVPDAMDPAMTYSGTTISFGSGADDIAGLTFSVELTDGDRWFAPHDKGNANASISTAATGVDTGVDVTAAGTYQRLRVEVDADGAVRCFIDKLQVVGFAAGCLDTDEEISPVFYVESTSAAVKSAGVRYITAYGKKA